MSWITDMRARDITSAGTVSVTIPGSDDPLVIPLRYPNGGDKAIVTEILEKMTAGGKNATPKLSTVMRLSDQASVEMLRACLDAKALEGDEPPTDEELTVLIRESGGDQGELMNRCAKLMGINSLAKTDGK